MSVYGGHPIDRHKCKADGNNVHLPMPRSAAENQWYKNYAAKVNIPSFWLGINDVDIEGEWRTDNGDLQAYFNWHPNQPNNYGKEDYIHFNGDGRWGDHSENGRYYVLCTYVLAGTEP